MHFILKILFSDLQVIYLNSCFRCFILSAECTGLQMPRITIYIHQLPLCVTSIQKQDDEKKIMSNSKQVVDLQFPQHSSLLFYYSTWPLNHRHHLEVSVKENQLQMFAWEVALAGFWVTISDSGPQSLVSGSVAASVPGNLLEMQILRFPIPNFLKWKL